MPIYLLEYLGQREQQIYLSVDHAGTVVETGSGVQQSAYRRAQAMSGPMRPFWVVAVFAAFIAIVLALMAIFP